VSGLNKEGGAIEEGIERRQYVFGFRKGPTSSLLNL